MKFIVIERTKIIIAKIMVKSIHRLYYLKGRIKSFVFRYSFASCGSHFKIYGNPIILDPEKIFVGNHVTINNGVQLCPRGKIVISDYVTMSRGSQITAGQLDLNQWSDSRYKNKVHVEGDVFIGEGTWLCVNSIVLPGVKISGKGVVVAAGAVVANDIDEDYIVVGGVPARKIKQIK